MRSVVFPWCLDARGTRTQLAAGPAPLSPTHSLTLSAGAINVPKGGTWHRRWAGYVSHRPRAASLRGELQQPGWNSSHISGPLAQPHTQRKVTSDSLLVISAHEAKKKAESNQSGVEPRTLNEELCMPSRHINIHTLPTPQEEHECYCEKPELTKQ